SGKRVVQGGSNQKRFFTQLRALTDGIGANGADAEYARNHVFPGRLEAHRDLLLVFHDLPGKSIFNVEEAHILFWATPFNGLLAELGPVGKNIELTPSAARIVAVGHDQDHGMGWIHGQFKRKPFGRLAAVTTHKLYRRGFLALLTEVSFRLHL